jgi:hypothetical protein
VLVSASTANVIDSIDTRTGRITPSALRMGVIRRSFL